MKRDSIANTFIVAGGLCIICSLLVSASAVLLRKTQEENVEVDRKRNILIVAGIADDKTDAATVDKLFKERIEDIIVDLETGENVTSEYGSPDEFDQAKAAKDEATNVDLKKAGINDIAKIKRRAKRSHVYLIKPEGSSSAGSSDPIGYVFPVRGYGLWSTMYGFLAVENDLQTVMGLTFYQQGETPGLGGEVQNKEWKAQWKGKKIYGTGEPTEDGLPEVELHVVKGQAADPNLEHKVDGLSGATITSNGVSNLLKYWMGPNGFGNFVSKQRGDSVEGQANSSISDGDLNG